MQRGFVTVVVVGMLVLSGCTGWADVGTDSAENGTVDPQGELEVHHIDVGQADSTLVITPDDETILIDTGDWREDGQDVIDYLEVQDIDRIDHLVTTHGHADHIGGHAAVIEHLEEHGDGVGAVYDPGVAHASATYDDYLEAVKTHEVTLFEVAEGDSLPLADDAVNATVLNPPEGESGDDLHYNSVMLLVEFDSFTHLVTGDAEQAAEQRLANQRGDDLDVGVYQAGHHGSSTSSTEPFLAAVEPRIAVISSPLESQYGHPHDETLKTFADRGVETYWTGIHGDVVVTTDGEAVTITTEREAPTDADELLERKHAKTSSDENRSAMAPSVVPAVVPASG